MRERIYLSDKLAPKRFVALTQSAGRVASATAALLNGTSVSKGLGAEAEAMLAEWREWDPSKANATSTEEV